MFFDISKISTTVTPRELLGKFLYDMIFVWGLAILIHFWIYGWNHLCEFCEDNIKVVAK